MGRSLRIGVIGSGISGLSAAWLLSRQHDVTLFEAEPRAGGHSNTVDAPGKSGNVAVDTGFIVYNVASYPNLIALFNHLHVPTAQTNMSFAVSLDNGGYEYAGSGLSTVFGQRSNLFSPSHWRMLADTLRFFRDAPALASASADESQSLGCYLAEQRYSDAFIERHILPMAAAIWSTPSNAVLSFPVAAFVRFFSNHGLLQLTDRPQWRTVIGGSREYVRRLIGDFKGEVRLADPVRSVQRAADRVTIATANRSETFDACVLATHAHDTLSLLADADAQERGTLAAFRYARNAAILHSDPAHMPRRRRLWSSWNYLGNGRGAHAGLSVSYWMNSLQPLGQNSPELFVTLNPSKPIASAATIAAFDYAHPIFDAAAMAAQRRLWDLQGRRSTWFCGSYFGYGFHEDGLQSGLAVAEDIGGVRRPWSVPDESSRIHLTSAHDAYAAVREAAQ